MVPSAAIMPPKFGIGELLMRPGAHPPPPPRPPGDDDHADRTQAKVAASLRKVHGAL